MYSTSPTTPKINNLRKLETTSPETPKMVRKPSLIAQKGKQVVLQTDDEHKDELLKDPLHFIEFIWNKPSAILEQHKDMSNLVNGLLQMMSTEKTAQEKYIKELQQNQLKIVDLRHKYQKQGNYIMIFDLIKLYEQSLSKLLESAEARVEYLEHNSVSPLTKALAGVKKTSDNLNKCVDLNKEYLKNGMNVADKRLQTEDKFMAYQQSVLIPDIIGRAISIYGDCVLPIRKEKVEQYKEAYFIKELDYSNAVMAYNRETKKILDKNVYQV